MAYCNYGDMTSFHVISLTAHVQVRVIISVWYSDFWRCSFL